MTVHKFDFNQGQEKLDQFISLTSDDQNKASTDPGSPVNKDDRDDLYYGKSEPQLANNFVDDNIDINYVEEVRETYINGFEFIDIAIKNYFSGIRIPTNKKGTEEYRMMNVKIAGGESATLITDRELRSGRLSLPALAITRTGESPDSKRFSPPYGSVAKKYKNNGRRVELIYRPNPYLIDYSLEIWTEYKSDAEFAVYSILSRFNPLASFYLNDVTGLSLEVVMKIMSSTDNSDLESDLETHAKIKKTINIQVEGWLPLATKVVPTILSKPTSVKEAIIGSNDILYGGETYLVNRDRT